VVLFKLHEASSVSLFHALSYPVRRTQLRVWLTWHIFRDKWRSMKCQQVSSLATLYVWLLHGTSKSSLKAVRLYPFQMHPLIS